MKAIKIISAVIIAIILFAAESLVMGLFAVDKAVSEDSVRESMAESDIVAQLVDEALEEATVNMGGQYGEMVKAIFRTEAMNGFVSEYVTAAINAELYGRQYEEIGEDDLVSAFSAGIDEVNASGTYNISPMEGELLKQAMQQEAPDLTAALNEQVGRYETLRGENTQQTLNEDLEGQPFMNPVVKVILVLVCVLMCAGLIVLCWRSKLGFLWCAVITALVSAIYLGLDGVVGEIGVSSAADRMMLSMVQNGFEGISAAGFIIAAVFLIAFVIAKIISRRKRNEKDIEITERFA